MDEEEEKEPSSQETRMADPSYQSSAQGCIIGFPGAVLFVPDSCHMWIQLSPVPEPSQPTDRTR